jgi:hypothetical protein
MAAENNLASQGFQKSDLSEMTEGSRQLTDKQRLLVFIDSLGDEEGKPRIIELHGGKTYPVKQYTEDFYSCDPDRFREVLQTMMNAAEAESYGLVFWGHGSGWLVANDSIVENQNQRKRAYAMDYGYGDSYGTVRWMNITQMVRSLRELPKFDYIFADCCNMMCVEIGYELRHATDYLIGSPAEIPGQGAPYHKIMPYLFQKDEALYKGLIDTYYDYYKDYYSVNPDKSDYGVPLSVIDTRQLEPLLIATRNILPSFMQQYPQSVDFSGKGITYYFLADAPVMYDVRLLMNYFALEENFSQWDVAFHRAVPYYRMSKRWMTQFDGLSSAFSNFRHDASLHGCVSMFVPRNISSYNSSVFQYNKTFIQFGWHRALEWNRFGWAGIN